MNYDIIGDIHGHSQSLEALLAKLNYKKEDGVYRHPSRKVIFLGDFIDRGKFQCEVIGIVRSMVESGAALSVMGNHEFNAIAYYTLKTGSDEYLRVHSDKNTKQHREFLKAYGGSPKEYEDTISWFKLLPLWLDLGDLKIVHACWDSQAIEVICNYQNGSPYLGDELLAAASHKDTQEYEAVETILKGKEVSLKGGASFHDKDGNERHEIRVRWWDHGATTYKEAFMGPESARTHIPEDEIHGDHLVEYAHDEPPVFLGHYWLEGEPAPLAPNIACLDYSVAKPGGKLLAYRWDGEQVLRPDKFTWVDRVES
jgi:hypothetical protein